MTTRVKRKAPSYIAKGFPQRLMNARVDAGYSREDVVTLVHGLVSVRTLFDWEHGNAYPRLGQGIRAVGEVLDSPLSWLLRGDPNGRAGADARSDDPRG